MLTREHFIFLSELARRQDSDRISPRAGAIVVDLERLPPASPLGLSTEQLNLLALLLLILAIIGHYKEGIDYHPGILLYLATETTIMAYKAFGGKSRDSDSFADPYLRVSRQSLPFPPLTSYIMCTYYTSRFEQRLAARLLLQVQWRVATLASNSRGTRPAAAAAFVASARADHVLFDDDDANFEVTLRKSMYVQLSGSHYLTA